MSREVVEEKAVPTAGKLAHQCETFFGQKDENARECSSMLEDLAAEKSLVERRVVGFQIIDPVRWLEDLYV